MFYQEADIPVFLDDEPAVLYAWEADLSGQYAKLRRLWDGYDTFVPWPSPRVKARPVS